jgi:hypothetical protein
VREAGVQADDLLRARQHAGHVADAQEGRHVAVAAGSDALGIVVDAGRGVKSVNVGQAVILDSWTGRNIIRGYETHDGFNAQFAVVDEERAIPVADELKTHSPERLAAMLLTYGTAYRAVVERLAVAPGDSVLLMGGGKGTSFAGAQIAKALGARVILMGSNAGLGRALIERGFLRDVAGRQIKREIEHFEAEVVGRANLVHRGAAGRECLHHLPRHALRPFGHALRDHAVIGGEDRDQRAINRGLRLALPGGHPLHDLFQPPQRASRLHQFSVPFAHHVGHVARGRRHDLEERAEIVERRTLRCHVSLREENARKGRVVLTAGARRRKGEQVGSGEALEAVP